MVQVPGTGAVRDRLQGSAAEPHAALQRGQEGWSQEADRVAAQVEHPERVRNMVAQMDKEGFGSCTNTGACEAECPKEISVDNIIKLNSAYFKYGNSK